MIEPYDDEDDRYGEAWTGWMIAVTIGAALGTLIAWACGVLG